MDDIEECQIVSARARANPFETIKGVFFLNRAAMKMANMDARFDWMFTNPKDENGVNYIKSIILFVMKCY